MEFSIPGIKMEALPWGLLIRTISSFAVPSQGRENVSPFYRNTNLIGSGPRHDTSPWSRFMDGVVGMLTTSAGCGGNYRPGGKGSEVKGYPQLHMKLKASLGYMKPKQKQQPKLCDLG